MPDFAKMPAKDIAAYIYLFLLNQPIIFFTHSAIFSSLQFAKNKSLNFSPARAHIENLARDLYRRFQALLEIILPQK